MHDPLHGGMLSVLDLDPVEDRPARYGRSSRGGHHQTAWAARAESRWATPLERIRYVTERKSAIAVVFAVGASVPTAVAVAVVTVPRPRDRVGSKRR